MRDVLRRAIRTIDRLDVQASGRVARAWFPRPIAVGLPALTRAADHSKLWMLVAGALVASGDPHARRGALRGMGSIAVASLVANQVGKRILPRRRPGLSDVPVERIAHRVPLSSSFPSGHSASAAAFAVGLACEVPALAVPVAALAGGVAFSRVYTGVHYPGDVIAGAALGATVAAVGKVLVPAHHAQPERAGAEPAAPQPPRPTGRGLVAVLNAASGDGFGPTVLRRLRDELPDAVLIEVADRADIPNALRRAATQAQVLGVAGGDGTVNAAATVAMEHDLPLLVIAAGTFNHFARDAGLPDTNDAIDALRTGRAVRSDMAYAADAPFLNTASLGSYPAFVRIRERWERRLGKPIATALAMIIVLRTCPPLDAEIDGIRRRLLMLFIGNGAYQPRGFVPRWRPCLDAGDLDVRYIDVRGRGAWLPLVGGVLTGNLHRSSRYVEQRRTSLSIRIADNPGDLARDGEVSPAPESVVFSVRQALTVYCGPRRPSVGRNATPTPPA